MTISELVVKITADAAGLIKGTDEASKQLDKLGGASKKATGQSDDLFGSLLSLKDVLAKSALVGAAIAASKAVIELSKDFAEAEISAKRLEIAANFNGVSKGTKLIGDLSDEIQQLTGASGDYVTQLGAQLIAQGKTLDQTELILTTAANLAAVTGQDLGTAVQQLSTTYSGMAGQLGKLNPELKDLTKEELEQGKAVEILSEKYGGMAGQLTNTTDVAFKRFNENLGDFAENVGAVFAPLLENIANFGSELLKVVNACKPAFELFGQVIGLVAFSIVGLATGFKGLQQQFNELKDSFDPIKIKQKEQEQAVRDQIKAVQDYRAELKLLSDQALADKRAEMERAYAAAVKSGMETAVYAIKLGLAQINSEVAAREAQRTATARGEAEARITASRAETAGQITDLSLVFTKWKEQNDARKKAGLEEIPITDAISDARERAIALLLNPDVNAQQQKILNGVIAQANAEEAAQKTRELNAAAIEAQNQRIAGTFDLMRANMANFEAADNSARNKVVENGTAMVAVSKENALQESKFSDAVKLTGDKSTETKNKIVANSEAAAAAAKLVRDQWLTALGNIQTLATSVFSTISKSYADMAAKDKAAADAKLTDSQKTLAALQDYYAYITDREQYIADKKEAYQKWELEQKAARQKIEDDYYAGNIDHEEYLELIKSSYEATAKGRTSRLGEIEALEYNKKEEREKKLQALKDLGYDTNSIMTDAEIQAAIEKAKKEAEAAAAAQVAQEKLNETRTAGLSTLQTIGSLGASLAKFITSGGTDIASLAAAIASLFDFSTMGQDADHLFSYISDLVVGLVTYMQPFFDAILQVFTELSPILSPIFKIAGDIFKLLTPIIELAGSLATLIAGPIKVAFDIIGGILNPIIDIVQKIVEGIKWVMDAINAFINAGATNPGSPTNPGSTTGGGIHPGEITIDGPTTSDPTVPIWENPTKPDLSVASASPTIVVNNYSPSALTPSESASMFKMTAQELAFTGVL